MRKVQVSLYKYPGMTHEVMVEGAQCPACRAVHELGGYAGVYFIIADGQLYRTEQLDENGQMLICAPVSEDDANTELLAVKDVPPRD